MSVGFSKMSDDELTREIEREVFVASHHVAARTGDPDVPVMWVSRVRSMLGELGDRLDALRTLIDHQNEEYGKKNIQAIGFCHEGGGDYDDEED